MAENREELLKKIKEEVLSLDGLLSSIRKKEKYFPVIGEGNHQAKIMLIGEAPGENEAKKGKPFCGRAGKVLDEILVESGIEREDIYITNIIKDRPPQNRDPLPEEIALYAPFLDKQIEIIKPKIIGTLGRFSAKYILEKYGFDNFFAISKINGKIYESEGLTFKVVPLFHPAAVIYSREKKKDLLKGFQIIKEMEVQSNESEESSS